MVTALLFLYYRVTPGLFRPTSVTRRRDTGQHRDSAVDVRGEIVDNWDTPSDNFSFQNNGIKKCTCWKTMRFFFKNNAFFKQCF